MSLDIYPSLSIKKINIDSLSQLAIDQEWGVDKQLDKALAFLNRGWSYITEGKNSLYTPAQKVEFAAMVMIRYMENYKFWTANDKENVGAILYAFEEIEKCIYEGNYFYSYLDTSEKVHSMALTAAFLVINESKEIQNKLDAYQKFKKVESFINYLGKKDLDDEQFDNDLFEKMVENIEHVNSRMDDIQKLNGVKELLPTKIQENEIFWNRVLILNTSLQERDFVMIEEEVPAYHFENIPRISIIGFLLKPLNYFFQRK